MSLTGFLNWLPKETRKFQPSEMNLIADSVLGGEEQRCCIPFLWVQFRIRLVIAKQRENEQKMTRCNLAVAVAVGD